MGFKKNLPSVEHVMAYDRFQVYLALRSNFTFLSKVIYMSLWILLGEANYIQSRDYIAEGKPHNEEFVARYQSFLQWAMLTMTFGRLALMVISFKKQQVCKIYIYYQILYSLLEECMPRDYGTMQVNIFMTNNVMNFCLLYYDFWPSSICMVLSQAVQMVIIAVVYEETITAGTVGMTIAAMVWQFGNLFLCHLIINSVGMLFVEADILRSGNEHLLNNLKEGVIIMDQETGMVKFANTAAKKQFKIRKNRTFAISLDSGENDHVVNKEEKLFALVDMKIFEEKDESSEIIKAITDINDYKSIDSIIHT